MCKRLADRTCLTRTHACWVSVFEKGHQRNCYAPIAYLPKYKMETQKMTKIVTNFRIHMIFVVALLLAATLAFLVHTRSHAQQSTGYSCRVDYAYEERSYGSYQQITIVNTGDYNLNLQNSTPIQWLQDNVEDIDYGESNLDGWDIFGTTVRLYPQRTRIAPGESYGGWSMMVYQSESAAPYPDSFSIGGLLCTSEQVELANFSCDTVSEIPQSECDALVAIYENTRGDDYWINNNGWLETNTPCSWRGVTCAEGHVSSMYLSGNGLYGQIPPEIGDLSQLKGLNLALNQLRGEIPPEIGNLSQLRSLNFAGNQLSGEIPNEIGNLTTLTRLSLGSNSLEGDIPAELGSLSNLKNLQLQRNNISGRIPAELGQLSSLSALFLSDTQLHSSIPHELTALDLRVFYYSGTDVCAPDTVEFNEWLESMVVVSSNNRVCTG